MEDKIASQLEEAALLGELTRPLVHEFNNFLNTILLQIAVMEAAGAGAHTDFEVMRKEGKQIGKTIADWHRFIKPLPEATQEIDINQVLRDCVSGPLLRHLQAGQVQLELCGGTLTAQAHVVPFRRFCSLLIRCTLDRIADPAVADDKIVVRTEKQQGLVVLTVRKNTRQLSAREVAELFDPARSVGSGLELALCKSLAYRFGGRLSVENQPQAGVEIRFVMPAAAD